MNVNDAIISVLKLKALADASSNGICPFKDVYDSDFKGVPYDSEKGEDEGDRIKYPIVMDSCEDDVVSYWEEKTTGIKGTARVILIKYEDGSGFEEPFIEICLEGYDNEQIIVDNGRMYII